MIKETVISNKTIFGWALTILLSVFGSYATSSKTIEDKVYQISNDQSADHVRINAIERQQIDIRREFLDNVKEINGNITDIKVSLQNKKDKENK